MKTRHAEELEVVRSDHAAELASSVSASTSEVDHAAVLESAKGERDEWRSEHTAQLERLSKEHAGSLEVSALSLVIE